MNVSHILSNLDAATALWALGGAGVVGLAAQLFKKAFKLESDKVIQFLVVSLGFAVSGLQYVIGSHNIPPTVLGLHTAALVGLAQPLYIYVIKPADNFIMQVKSYNAGKVTPATASVTTTITTPSATKSMTTAISNGTSSTEADF